MVTSTVVLQVTHPEGFTENDIDDYIQSRFYSPGNLVQVTVYGVYEDTEPNEIVKGN